LLKGQACRQRQLTITGVPARQEPGQNHHRLAVNGAAQFGLALNIHHLPFARSGSGCNTGGLPEHRRSEPEYRKTIHLSHFLAGGGNHHHTPADLLAASLPHPTGPILPFINGLLEVAGFDRIGACLASPMICLTQNVPEHPVAKQHHLDRHRNRLRLQTDGTHQPIQPLKGLDAYFTGGQNALQRFPMPSAVSAPGGHQ
jgi:hypothetical protein